MSRSRPIVIAVALLVLGPSQGGLAFAATGEVERLVGDLSHDQFARREAATDKLKEVGLVAVEATTAAALGDDPEAALRARNILESFVDTFEPELVKAVLRSLQSAGGEGATGAAARAAAVRSAMVDDGRSRSARHLTELGLPMKEDALRITDVRVGQDWKGSDKDLRHLLRFPELEVLNISNTKTGDEFMAIVPRLEKLEKLYVGYSGVTTAGLGHLQEASSLAYLSLQGLELGDEAAAHLAPMKHLKHLGLDFTQMTDAGLADVVGLKDLETLWLNGLKIEGPGLQNLVELPRLKKLILAKSPFSDKGLPHLAKLTQLEELGLDDTGITGEGLGHLESLTRVRKIWFNRTLLTDAAVADLGKLKSLEYLDLSGTKISQDGVEKLRALLPDCEISLE